MKVVYNVPGPEPVAESRHYQFIEVQVGKTHTTLLGLKPNMEEWEEICKISHANSRVELVGWAYRPNGNVVLTLDEEKALSPHISYVFIDP